ncbi:MAG: hypothetical protein L6246_01480 [Thermodesulfovibrionales bacterium]|nr:hypothetical protein [Nitrospinota bacterium]MCG2708979.1 hypothetical protein [Thermodesulfovibrionales bacterium]
MDVGEWQKRLEKTFSIDGIVGKRLLDIIDAEKTYGIHIAGTYHGHLVLINAFFDFYIETIQKAIKWIQENGWPKNLPNYPVNILQNVTNFKSFRAADTLFINEYPLDGYSLLRDLKDRAIFLGAIIHKLTNFSLLAGITGLNTVSRENMIKIIATRKKEEQRVHDLMIGEKSSLPSDIVSELKFWEKLFHEEVHGSKLTLAEVGVDWLKGKAPLHLEPIPNTTGMAMYMNRASEVGWLLTRTFPFLQPVENAFGEDWKSKQIILDESFRVMNQGLEKMGKKIATAFIYFVDNKFSFPENLHCSE